MDKTKYENKMITNIRGVPLHGLKPGGKRMIKVDKNGTPIEQLWRKRKKDGDIQFVSEEVNLDVEEIDESKKKKKGRDK
jgi:hypothetical protein